MPAVYLDFRDPQRFEGELFVSIFMCEMFANTNSMNVCKYLYKLELGFSGIRSIGSSIKKKKVPHIPRVLVGGSGNRHR